jgi:hypothetical protein
MITLVGPGPGDRGSWVWIGEGPQQGMAALFTLDVHENLTWTVLTPQSAKKYPRGIKPQMTGREANAKVHGKT